MALVSKLGSQQTDWELTIQTVAVLRRRVLEQVLGLHTQFAMRLMASATLS